MKNISYLPLEIELKRCKMSKTELQKQTQLSTATIAKISKNEDISMKSIKTIADVLNCDIDKIITFKNVYIERGK